MVVTPQFQSFKLPAQTWSTSIERNAIMIYSRQEFAYPENLFLETPNSERVNLLDLELNDRISWDEYTEWIVVCIKQQEYLPELQKKCTFFWDLDLKFDKNGLPIPFEYTLSGVIDGDASKLLVNSVRSIPISNNFCELSETSPVQKFSEYTPSYGCETDADCAPLSGILGDTATMCYDDEYSPKFCTPQTYLSGAQRPYRSCEFDFQCAGSTEYCSWRGLCTRKDNLMKVRSLEEHVVIEAGETKSIVFRIEELRTNHVAIETVMNIVSTQNPSKFDIKYGLGPQEDDEGFAGRSVDRYEQTPYKCRQIPADAAGDFFTATYDIEVQGDTGFTGDWEFTITNNNAEQATILGAYWALDTSQD